MKVSRYPHARTRNDDWKIIVFALIMLGIGAVIGGVVGVFLFIRITGGNATPSEPISAPTLSVETLNSSTQSTEVLNEVSTTTVPPIIGSSSAQATPVATTVPQVVIVPTSTILSPRVFRIASEESEARFSVFETFPIGTAIGRTSQIAGDIIVDFNTPSNSQIGTIRVNLRTLRTGDFDRDSSIRCCVLLTGQDVHEFTDFIPTSISGLPERIEIGQTIAFQVTGNLTLRGITRPVRFDISLTIISTEELRGLASATVNRSDFGILNDSENGFDYHGVEEEIALEFDFVARAVLE